MRKLLFILVLLMSNPTWAEWKVGADQKHQECQFRMTDISHSTGSQPVSPLYEIDFVFGGVSYLGILSEVKKGKTQTFETFLKKFDKKAYTRVVGSPSTVNGLSTITFIGKILTNAKNKITGTSVKISGEDYGEKQFTCML